MGCSCIKSYVETEKSLSLSNDFHRSQTGNLYKYPDASEEQSINQVSIIAAIPDNKPRFSEDPSVLKMIEDI